MSLEGRVALVTGGGLSLATGIVGVRIPHCLFEGETLIEI